MTTATAVRPLIVEEPCNYKNSIWPLKLNHYSFRDKKGFDCDCDIFINTHGEMCQKLGELNTVEA